jgi:hypothetical protein
VKHCLETAEIVALPGEVAEAGRRVAPGTPAPPPPRRAPAARATADTLRHGPPVPRAPRTVVTGSGTPGAGGR